jgi:hypothetical protein
VDRSKAMAGSSGGQRKENRSKEIISYYSTPEVLFVMFILMHL